MRILYILYFHLDFFITVVEYVASVGSFKKIRNIICIVPQEAGYPDKSIYERTFNIDLWRQVIFN